MSGLRAAIFGAVQLVACNPFLPDRQASYPRAVDVIELGTKNASPSADPFAVKTGPEGNEVARFNIAGTDDAGEIWTCTRLHRMDGECEKLVVSCESGAQFTFGLTLSADGRMMANSRAAAPHQKWDRSWFELNTLRSGDRGAYIGRSHSSPGASHLIRVASTKLGTHPVRRALPTQPEFNELAFEADKVFLSIHAEHPDYHLILAGLTVIAETWVEAAPHFRACTPAPSDPNEGMQDI